MYIYMAVLRSLHLASLQLGWRYWLYTVGVRQYIMVDED